jgi:hypothetical protein
MESEIRIADPARKGQDHERGAYSYTYIRAVEYLDHSEAEGVELAVSSKTG